MKFKHVIWDFDGTLFDSYPIVVSAFYETLVKFGIVEDMDEIYSFMKIALSHTNEYYKAKYNLDDSFFEQYQNLRTIYDREKTKPFNGAVALCKAIYKADGKNYLYTHRDSTAVDSLKKFDMSKYFTEFVTSQNRFSPKPSPDAILYLLKKYNFSRDEAIMIGDRDIDILSGQKAGISTCYVSDERGIYDHATYNANNFAELFAILGVQ